ncbi:MAG: hypothetical protein RLZZ58_761 [Pseudomonadota bacterium]
MSVRTIMVIPAMIALSLTLGACRPATQDKAALDPLDDGLTNSDPAIKGALEDQIMVDPKLAGQANQNAVTPGNQPVDGRIPAVAGGKAGADAELAAAKVAGKLMRAPDALPMDEDCTSCDAKRPVTLGAMARNQTGGSCDAKLTYGNEWADRLPAAFRVYPRAFVKEAAGVAGGKCNVRVVNFETSASPQAVLDYYYTMARKAGFTAEHRAAGGEHMLGGTRGDDAFVVMLRQDGTGPVDVDIVASGGR